MAWFSILPESLAIVETWLIRLFLFLGAICMGPWVLLIIYDAILFIIRTVAYEVPIWGGRARHQPRPRAPSLSERPSGQPRQMGLGVAGHNVAAVEDTIDDMIKKVEGAYEYASRPNGYTDNEGENPGHERVHME